MKSPRSLFFLLLIITLLGCSGRLSDFDVGVAGDGKLDAALERIRDQHGLPALGAVLIKNGEIVDIGAVVSGPPRSSRWYPSHRAESIAIATRTTSSPERDFAMLTVTNAGDAAAREGTDVAIRALIDRFDAADRHPRSCDR